MRRVNELLESARLEKCPVLYTTAPTRDSAGWACFQNDRWDVNVENNDPEDAYHDLKQATGSHFKRLYLLDETWAYQESQGFGVKCGKQHDPSLKNWWLWRRGERETLFVLCLFFAADNSVSRKLLFSIMRGFSTLQDCLTHPILLTNILLCFIFYVICSFIMKFLVFFIFSIYFCCQLPCSVMYEALTCMK